MDKLENWIIFGLLAAILFKVNDTVTPEGCNQTTSTGWGVSDLLANGEAQSGTLAGMGCNCG